MRRLAEEQERDVPIFAEPLALGAHGDLIIKDIVDDGQGKLQEKVTSPLLASVHRTPSKEQYLAALCPFLDAIPADS